MYSAAQIRQIRALDGVTYSLSALAVIFYFPDLFRDLPATPSFFSLLPIVFLCVATHFFPKQKAIPIAFHPVLLRMKLASITAVGFCPFIVWWLRMPEHLYFMFVSGLAAGAFVWYLLELLDFLAIFMRKVDEPRIAFEAVIARTLLLYFILVPFGAVFTALFAAKAAPGQWGDILDFIPLWEFAPMAMRLILLLAPLLTLVVLGKGRKHVLAPKAKERILVASAMTDKSEVDANPTVSE